MGSTACVRPVPTALCASQGLTIVLAILVCTDSALNSNLSMFNLRLKHNAYLCIKALCVCVCVMLLFCTSNSNRVIIQ